MDFLLGLILTVITWVLVTIILNYAGNVFNKMWYKPKRKRRHKL